MCVFDSSMAQIAGIKTFFGPILLIVLLYSSTLSFSSPFLSKQKEFDYYLLSLQWPGTACKSVSKCCHTNGCCDSSAPRSEFTIHGLWADYDNGSWPACCFQSDNANFDINQVLPLLGDLQKYWPSYSCSSTSICHGRKGLFWAHEWEKHGTCMFPYIKDEYTYFSTTLDLYAKYNITKMLQSAGFIVASATSYPLKDVIAAIENSVGASPTVVCSKGAVKEIRICFYKNFEPRDCVIGSNGNYDKLYWGGCPKNISLPSCAPIAKSQKATLTWSAEDGDTQNAIALPSVSNWRDVFNTDASKN